MRADYVRPRCQIVAAVPLSLARRLRGTSLDSLA
jgi:hypothetical protein